MSDFHTRQSSLDRALLDPAQHVHFAQGMVLGTDDFNQEFAWLSGRDRWAMRAAIGYGTVTGLRVSFGQNGSLWEVRVGPGVAVTPAGHLVRVAREQCADLAAWITAHPEALSLVTQPDGGVATVRLRVMLNYRECLTDPVPIAGDACRTEEDSLQPSRVTDDFTLELAREDEDETDGVVADPPTPREEDAVRWLVAWLRDRIELAGTSDPSNSLEDFLDELREEARSTDAPRRGDPVVSNTTPEGDDRGTPPSEVSYRLSPEDAARFVREALRVWVVELRERWHRDRMPLRHGPRPTDQRPIDEPVLLTVLRVPLARVGEGPWTLHPNAALEVTQPPPADLLRLEVDDRTRPWLLHLRMLQELVLQQMHLLPPPGDSVVEETAWGQAPDEGEETAYSRADHTHGTPTPTGDVTADESGELRVRAIQHHAVRDQQPVSGDVLVWTPIPVDAEVQPGEWVPTPQGDLSVDGDVTGTLDATRVEALQRRAVADEDPDANDLLAWQGTEGAEAWRPFDRGALPLGNGDLGDVVGTLREPRVQGLQNRLVASTAPGDGQVLTFRGGMWQPEAPTVSATLEGDVVTEETEGGTRTRVVALQGGPLAVGNPPPAPDGGQVLTWTGNQWEPRTPVIVTPPGVDPVQSPGGSNEYRIVAAGTLALFRPEIPAVGTPGLRVTPEGRIASANHQLIEFTYTHHIELFQRSFRRNRAPMHGFVVKAMLVPMMSEWPDVVGDPNLRQRGLAWLREQYAAALERSAAAWVVLGPVTISCELVSEAGIVLRVTTGRVISQVRQLFDNALLNVEVSWCPRWRPEANP